ncbi:MAG: SIR2 family protein [Burkholderiales bacterium]|nr:SIR2 family protein [Burkholderiales bacterium]
MKIGRLRQEVEKLFVLGAGASFGLSEVDVRKREFARTVTPLDKDFLARLRHFRPGRGWQRRIFDRVEDQWLDRDQLVSNGLERAIIKRVSQFDFLSSLHPRKTRDHASNAQYVNDISHLITDYLLGCKSNSSGNTKKFVNWVFPAGIDPRDHKNRIITFNYDTLIERPLLERGVSRKKIYFDRLSSKREDGLRRNADERFPHPLILKLHGSANWRCGRSEFETMIAGAADPKTQVYIWSEDHACPDPDDSVSPLIIPPVPNKPITAASIFLHLWTRAYEYLHESKELVIVGYSCPPTDTLARTMFSHFDAHHLERVTIVDPDALALARYRELMAPKIAASAKWSYFSSFDEYIRHEVS